MERTVTKVNPDFIHDVTKAGGISQLNNLLEAELPEASLHQIAKAVGMM